MDNKEEFIHESDRKYQLVLASRKEYLQAITNRADDVELDRLMQVANQAFEDYHDYIELEMEKAGLTDRPE